MNQDHIRVVIAEDNAAIRTGIRKMLRKASGIELIAEARNGLEALRIVSEMAPDVLLLDIEMPVLDGIAVTKRLNANAFSTTRIIVLSAYTDGEYIREILAHGASGYLLKDEAPEHIVEAIHDVALGKKNWIAPHEENLSKNKERRNIRP